MSESQAKYEFIPQLAAGYITKQAYHGQITPKLILVEQGDLLYRIA